LTALVWAPRETESEIGQVNILSVNVDGDELRSFEVECENIRYRFDVTGTSEESRSRGFKRPFQHWRTRRTTVDGPTTQPSHASSRIDIPEWGGYALFGASVQPNSTNLVEVYRRPADAAEEEDALTPEIAGTADCRLNEHVKTSLTGVALPWRILLTPATLVVDTVFIPFYAISFVAGGRCGYENFWKTH
jgi:hypothetical protein